MTPNDVCIDNGAISVSALPTLNYLLLVDSRVAGGIVIELLGGEGNHLSLTLSIEERGPEENGNRSQTPDPGELRLL